MFKFLLKFRFENFGKKANTLYSKANRKAVNHRKIGLYQKRKAFAKKSEKVKKFKSEKVKKFLLIIYKQTFSPFHF
jgi:hypothetical protein